MNHAMPGIMWALVRQLPEQIMKQLDTLRTSGRVKEIIAEVYEQVNQAADGAWLSRHGISDPSVGK